MTDATDPAAVLDGVRRRRRRTGDAAARLHALDGERTRLATKVPWTAIESLPDWCLMSDERRTRLQGICGALYCLPDIAGSLDGAFLGRWRLMLGDTVFDEILATDPHALDGGPHADRERMPEGNPGERAAAGGAAILLGTLANEHLRALFAPLLGSAAAVPGHALVEAVHSRAAGIADRHPVASAAPPDAP